MVAGVNQTTEMYLWALIAPYSIKIENAREHTMWFFAPFRLRGVQTACDSRFDTQFNDSESICRQSHAQNHRLQAVRMGRVRRAQPSRDERFTFVLILQPINIRFFSCNSFHLPNDSTLLSSCVFKLRVSLFAAINVWRCFCAGSDAHRFNFDPPLAAPTPPPPLFGARILRTLFVPCISLCDAERWTFREMKMLENATLDTVCVCVSVYLATASHWPWTFPSVSV